MRIDRLEIGAQELVTKLIESRLSKAISVNKLAWMAGVSPSAIAFLESRTHSPTLRTFLKIAAALEVDVAELYREAKEAASRID